MIQLGSQVVGQGHYGDNALKLHLPNPDGWTIHWHYEDDSELFTVICLRRHFEGIDMKLHVPYLPHARMDRVKNPEDVFTLKYFCEVINSLNFSEVIIEDPHSQVGVDLLNNVTVVEPTAYIQKTIECIGDEDLVICFPDKGAANRYYDLLEVARPTVYGEKIRNWESGRIEGLTLHGDVDKIAGRDVLIIDDICSYGGTFARAAQALAEAGARNIYLYVTHCEENIHKGDIFTDGLIKEVYTTDSIYNWLHASKYKTYNKVFIVN